jgi:hypothetical protein
MVEKIIDLAEADRVKWLDGNWWGIDGKLVTREERALDHAILQKMRFGDLLESQLAAKLACGRKDKVLIKSLERLSQKGCIIRMPIQWDYRGFWAPIEDPNLTMTSKGTFLAAERLPND